MGADHVRLREGDEITALERDYTLARGGDVYSIPVRSLGDLRLEACRAPTLRTLRLKREQKALSPAIGDRVVAVGTCFSRPSQG